MSNPFAWSPGIKTVTMIDPPSGWRYGFPKALPWPQPEDVKKWLVENGYPQKEIDACGDHFHCRMWEEEVDKSDSLE